MIVLYILVVIIINLAFLGTFVAIFTADPELNELGKKIVTIVMLIIYVVTMNAAVRLIL
ncbi:hypothetical protein [Listeria booriae]|uniref:hypothetical protein n=1 Tax=Listeria booriae TaxID=1552123 RepID=UPI001629A31E|nr:hypothetical protein [Listeria booriae]MBC2149743.1 hypothetical protein [Listeria booriae]MBC2305857.1 hypothetical protein [Listeria booriae]